MAEEEASEESMFRSLLNFAGRSWRRQAEATGVALDEQLQFGL